MEERNTVNAVVAEGLVFESNFGGAEAPAASSNREVVKPARSISAWNAAAIVCETIKTSDPRA